MNKLPLLFAIFLLSASAASRDFPALIPRAVLFGNPERILPQVSADGTMLAWIAPAHAVLNIWVREIDKPAAAARAITADPKRGIRDFFWQCDSKHVIYLQDHDGDENWHLYQVRVSGSTPQVQDLTPGKLQARILARSPDFPDHVVIALNERDARFHDAYLLDLNTVERKLVAQNPGDIEYYMPIKSFTCALPWPG